MNLKAWWQLREPRERLILTAAALILFCLSLYLMLEPLIAERSRMVVDIPQLQVDLDWMLSNADELQRLRDNQGSSTTIAGQAMSAAFIQSLLREMQLENVAAELGTAINRGVSLEFGEVNYPELVEFLYQLTNRSDARISEAGITRLVDQPGMVRARLVFRPAGIQ